jgi:hypothetical protein
MAQQPLVAQGLLVIEVSLSHSETSHSVGLLWASDRPVAETSTWQQTTLTRDKHTPSGIRTPHPSKRAAVTFMCGRHQVRISWLRHPVIPSVYCGQYPRTPEPSRVNPLLSDLTGGKIGSEKSFSRLFGIRFLAHRCTFRNLNNRIRQYLRKKKKKYTWSRIRKESLKHISKPTYLL